VAYDQVTLTDYITNCIDILLEQPPAEPFNHYTSTSNNSPPSPSRPAHTFQPHNPPAGAVSHPTTLFLSIPLNLSCGRHEVGRGEEQ